ncbi:WD repeat-containing protein 63-like, partial [Sinocyclocheilus anshuiensis]|uniref:WD repeat-containing protein 63-like n=1 Tax=Sinocyclocheilus anshuiensis TaxID=1608454 RepID=UPI0007B99EB0
MSLIPTNFHKVHKHMKSIRIKVHFKWKLLRCVSDALCADSEQVKGAGLSEDCVRGLSIKLIPASETNSNRMFGYRSRCLVGIKLFFLYNNAINLLIRDMSSKRPKSKEARKIKGKDKKKENNFPTADEGASEPDHPDYIFPLVLTSATQELFGCRSDEDLTGENPYKLLKKEDIIQDMKTRASVSDFSPIKQLVLDYPEDELLLVFDRDFIYGQSFYLPLVQGDDEEQIKHEEEEEEEMIIPKTPESHPWISLGSEQEIEEESVTESRPRLRYKISPLLRRCGAPVCFSDRSALDGKEGFMECPSYQDKSFSIREMERHTAIQASSDTKHSSTQTLWKYPRNMWTQYESRKFGPEEKEHHLRSENLKNFITSVLIRFEISLQQNHITDVFCDDWTALCEEDGALTGKTETQLKEYQSFMDLHFSKEKTISHIHWHPTIS